VLVLIRIITTATPALQTWTQSTGLYIGGDQSAFFARYPAPVTPVVSLRYRFHSCFTNSCSRPMCSSRSKLLRLAVSLWTFLVTIRSRLPLPLCSYGLDCVSYLLVATRTLSRCLIHIPPTTAKDGDLVVCSIETYVKAGYPRPTVVP
jgi:hypothetical protein